MARKRYGKTIAKAIAAAVLAVIAFIGLEYGSVLRQMDAAAAEYNHGDASAALKTYQRVDATLRDYGAMHIIPSRDRQNLLLNEARLFYSMKRYQDSADMLEKEDEIAGTTDDGRFFLLRGDIGFRRAISDYQESSKKDTNLLQENLMGAQDSLREALTRIPDDWDAKYNYEYIDYIRKMLSSKDSGKMKLLQEEESKPQKKELPPELAG